MRLILQHSCVALCVISLLTACSGGSGEEVTSNPDLTTSVSLSGPVLNGPPAQTNDIQRFRINLWENIAPTNRCGQCHGTGGQSPMFARNDDINLAYEAATSLVNLNQPSQSRLVEKVSGGHNCWLASDQACGDIMTTWITNWAGDSATSTTTIEFRAPALRDPGASKSFPDDATAFAPVHNLLTTYCSGCHRDDAAIPQSPFFAVADLDAAYDAARSKIEIDDPDASRLVVRLGSEFHNCWSNCAANAAEMLTRIETFIGTIPETEVDPSFITSKALALVDGLVASGGGRNDGNAIALFQFKTLSGSTAFDTSGVDPALDLTFTGDVSWVGGWGIQFGDGARAQATTTASTKLFDLIRATGEYSIEAWAAPANVTQEDARIVSYSGGDAVRNMTLGQTLYNYDFLARSSVTDANGDPALSTPDADEVLQATLQHVVATFDPTNGRQLYVNGARIDVADGGGGTLNDWDDTFAFVLGNEVSGNRPWRGVLRLVAVHNRALTASQILENFDAGVGEQFYLLFGVSHLINVADAFIVLKVSVFDSYSYLFAEPFFITLDDPATISSVPVRGMRIGINGREPEVGQAFQNMDVTLQESMYATETGIALSPIGTIFGIEKGTDADEFFLTFEQIGDNFDVRLTPIPDPLPPPVDSPAEPELGIRLFDEINASMSAITRVATSQTDVYDTFTTVRQQLPSGADIEGFLSSQQMGITQLAIEYCNVLIEDTTLRAALFPSFNFDAIPASAFDAAGRDALLDPLLVATLGDTVLTQPDPTLTKNELDSLITILAAGGGNATRTRTIAKATCAASLGSAAMLIQ